MNHCCFEIFLPTRFFSFLPREFFFAMAIFFLFWYKSIFTTVGIFMVLSESLFFCGSFYVVVRIFLLLWELFFCCEKFSSTVRIFMVLWEFFLCCENFSPENSKTVVRIFLLKAKNFGKLCKKALVTYVACNQCCEQDLIKV